MTLPVFPANAGRPQSAGYRVDTQNSVGSARLGFTGSFGRIGRPFFPTLVTASWVINGDVRGEVEDFYRANRARRFTAPVSTPFADTNTVTFEGAPSWEALSSTASRFTAQLRIHSMAAGPQSMGEALIFAGNSFETVADAAAATLDSTVNFVATAGYTSIGDKGGALYRRAGGALNEPSHDGKFQTPDGVWWELAEGVATPQMFGALGDGANDDGPAIKSACDFAIATFGEVHLPEAPNYYRLGSGNHVIAMQRDLKVTASGAKLVADHSDGVTFQFRAVASGSPNYTGSSTRGDISFTAADAATVSPGDLIAFTSTRIWETTLGYPQREVHIATEVIGNAISIAEPMVFDYIAASDGVQATSHVQAKLTLVGPLTLSQDEVNATANRIIDLIYLNGSLIEDLRIVDPQLRMAAGGNGGGDPLALLWCVGTTVRNVFTEGCRYPINVSNGTRDTRIEDVTSQLTWHPVDFSIGAHGAVVSRITGRGNTATVNAHASFDIAYEHVRCYNAEGANLRSIGGRLTDVVIDTDKAWEEADTTWTIVALSPEYNTGGSSDALVEADFIVEGFVLNTPNAVTAAANRIRCGMDFRSMVVRDSHFAVLDNSNFTARLAVHVSNSTIQRIVHRGEKLTVEGSKLIEAHPSIPAGLQSASNAYEGVFGKDVIFEACTFNGHDHVVLPNNNSTFRFLGCLFENIGTDFFDAGGSTGFTVLVLIIGCAYANCSLSAANINGRTLVVKGAEQQTGSGVNAAYIDA